MKFKFVLLLIFQFGCFTWTKQSKNKNETLPSVFNLNIIHADGFDAGNPSGGKQSKVNRSLKTKNKKSQTFDISMTTAENVCLPVSHSSKKTSVYRTGTAAWYANHYNELMKGIPDGKLELNLKENEGTSISMIAVFKEKAFAIHTNNVAVTVAGAEYGKGRVIVMTRAEYADASRTDGSVQTFVDNAIKWLAQKSDQIQIASENKNPVGKHTDHLKIIAPKDLSSQKDINVYYRNAQDDVDEEGIKSILEFVQNGGGLLIFGQAWYWVDFDKKTVLTYPGNKILLKMGFLIYGSIEILPQQSKGGIPPEETNFMTAIKKVGNKEPDNPVALATFISMAEVLVNPETANMEDFKAYIETYTKMALGLNEKKIKNSPLYSILIQSTWPILTQKQSDHLHGYHDVAYFPYDFEEKDKIDSKKIEVEGNTHKLDEPWEARRPKPKNTIRSTQLYAKAGTVVEVIISKDLIGKISVQVGCHSDQLYHIKSEELQRPPNIVLEFAAVEETIKIASPFGGLIYILVPSNSDLTKVEATFKGVYPVPFFVQGKTTNEEWKTIKNNPAPWGELEIPGSLIITYPSEEMRKIENMEEVANWHGDAMKHFVDLMGTSKMQIVERLAWDKQISAGQLHSGYPAMGYAGPDSESTLNLEALKASGAWGMIHEIGHNIQWISGFYVKSYVETTNNFWSLYVSEKMVPGGTGLHVEIQGDKPINKMKEWFKAGKPKDKFDSIWMGLDMMTYPTKHFGWEGITVTMKACFELGIAEDENDYYDRWTKHYSAAVKTNMCDFFGWFDVKISDETKKYCQTLPEWKENPTKSYESEEKSKNRSAKLKKSKHKEVEKEKKKKGTKSSKTDDKFNKKEEKHSDKKKQKEKKKSIQNDAKFNKNEEKHSGKKKRKGKKKSIKEETDTQFEVIKEN